MKTIRVKTENQAIIIDSLKEAGFEASPCEAPLAEWEYEKNNFNNQDDQTSDSTIGMAGISTSASGKQAHRVINSLKERNIIN